MSEIVPAEQIETLVGARRHPLAHLGRAVSAEQTVYILHSRECKASGIDLRACDYSLALDHGVDVVDWRDHFDQTVTLMHAHGWLMPDDNGPDDVVEMRAPGSTT